MEKLHNNVQIIQSIRLAYVYKTLDKNTFVVFYFAEDIITYIK